MLIKCKGITYSREEFMTIYGFTEDNLDVNLEILKSKNIVTVEDENESEEYKAEILDDTDTEEVLTGLATVINIIKEVRIPYDDDTEADSAEMKIRRKYNLDTAIMTRDRNIYLVIYNCPANILELIKRDYKFDKLKKDTADKIVVIANATGAVVEFAVNDVALSVAKTAFIATGKVTKTAMKLTAKTASSLFNTGVQAVRDAGKELSEDQDIIKSKQEFAKAKTVIDKLFKSKKAKAEKESVFEIIE